MSFKVLSKFLGESRGCRLAPVLLCGSTILQVGCSAGATSESEVGDRESAIVSGTNATNASLFPKSTVGIPGCTGTIISPQHVLTARHCSPSTGGVVTFFSDSAPTAITRTVKQVYYDGALPSAGVFEDPGNYFDTKNHLDDWAVLYLDSAVPTGYQPAKLASSMLAVGSVAYQVGVGEHDGTTPFGTIMKYHKGTVTNSMDRPGEITAAGVVNPGDSGGPLFSYLYETGTHTVPSGLTVHGDLFGNQGNTTTDAVYTSTAGQDSSGYSSHFASIMSATGLAITRGTVGGTNSGASFATADANACAATCRYQAACSGFRFTASGTSCQLLSATTTAVPDITSANSYGLKQSTGACATQGDTCKLPRDRQLDYFVCGQDGDSCAANGPTYMAYGAHGQYVYKAINTALPSRVLCAASTFGGVDPAPGSTKSCWFANYGFMVGEYGTATAAGEVAYGVDGVFKFAQVSGSYTCNNAKFGDPAPGKTKSCYAALPGYQIVAGEGGSLPPVQNIPMAFGSNGHFLFRLISGTQPCNQTTFGGDPSPGTPKYCYQGPDPLLGNIFLTGGSGWNNVPSAHGAVDSSGTFSLTTSNLTVTNPAVVDFPSWASLVGVKKLSGDFNGDRSTDLMLIGGGLTTVPVAYGNAAGDGFVSKFTVTNQPLATFQGWASGPGVKAITGDFDGDGLDDVALFGGGFTTLPVAYASNTSHGDFSVQNTAFATFQGWASQPGAVPVSGDFNHDGYTDVALIGSSGFTTIPIALGSATRGAFTLMNVGPNADAATFQGWSTYSGAVAVSGDFDGDSKVDIALVGSSSFTTMPVALSNGDGTFTLVNDPLPAFTGWASASNTKAIASDFDGDGLADIALVGASAFTTVPIAKGSSAKRGTFSFLNPPLASFQTLATTAGVVPLSGPKAQ